MLSNKRRSFIKTMIIGGITLKLPFVYSCNTNDLDFINIVIEDKHYQINIQLFKEIANILFPKTQITPSASELKADIYYLWILGDIKLRSSKRHYLASNLSRIDNFCKKNYGKSLIYLSKSKKEEAIFNISREKWGENYLSSLMTIIIEAMLANPVYGSNPDNIGREWLNFKGGYPQPTIKNKYPEILNINHIQNEK